MTGKVFLVGCGPGAPDLMTLRAKNILQETDVVLYDRLINEEVLDYAGGAEKIDVGKKPGEASKQEEINQLLYSKAKEGKTVARLKNGNPVIFGRGGEELQFLWERGIEVEIVPGLSSASSLPPLQRIPLTQRGISSSVSILSGYGAGGEEPDWEEVGDTAVVLMTVGNLPNVVENLLENGKEEESLGALISSGSTENERLLVSPLFKIVEMAEVFNIEPPSILVVGDVVERLLQVSGRTVGAFRPISEKERTENLVESAGGKPRIYGICEAVPQKTPELKNALSEEWEVLVFLSSNGVRALGDVVDLSKHKCIAIGERTKKSLEEEGCKEIVLPEERSSKGVEKLLEKSGEKALAFRSSLAEEAINGAKNITAYSIQARSPEKVLENYLTDKPDFTILTSSGMLKIVQRAAKESGEENELKKQFEKSFVLSLGRKTTKYAISQDVWINYELPKPNLKYFFSELSK